MPLCGRKVSLFYVLGRDATSLLLTGLAYSTTDEMTDTVYATAHDTYVNDKSALARLVRCWPVRG